MTRAHAFRAVWRWHFCIALAIAPVLLVLCATGSLYLFDRKIQAFWNRDYAVVAPAGPTQPLASQEAAVLMVYPEAAIRQIVVPRSGGRASEWSVRTAEGVARTVFVDPYRAQVTGSVDPRLQPIEIARRLHSALLAEPVGSYLVELAAGWTLILAVSGIYLWWPIRWRLKGVLVPRLAASGRPFWRDLHAIPAMLLSLFLGFLVLTGMPWSVFWGETFAELGGAVPALAPSPGFATTEPARRTATADDGSPATRGGGHHHPGDDGKDGDGLPWTIRHMTSPTGSGGAGIGLAQIEPLLAGFDTARFGGGLRIFYPAGPAGVFRIGFVPDKAQGQRTLFVDPGDGAILADIGWNDYSPAGKLVEWGVMTHMGRQYGLANQLVNLTVCLGLVGSIVAGLVLWWRRRPQGALGLPPREPGDRLPTGLWAAFIAIGVLFPPVGVTLLVVVVVGRLRGIRRE